MDAQEWWKQGIVYQIYPMSFMDSDADGIGDLQGIRMRLDHLAWLGVQAVWLSPIFRSPMVDFGYDVSDYTDISPLFGSLTDFDALVAEIHGRGMRVILDYVPNHTSDQHPWFLESRSSRNSPKRDWYIWRDPAPDGGYPNNWLSGFGGSGWEWDANTGQYYYHAYLKQQPDLNWRNPEVREAMFDVLRFWLERGVDGFRVDALWHLIKDDQFRDDPPNPSYAPGQSPYQQNLPLFSGDRPEIHDLIKDMRGVLGEYDRERLLIGEIYLPLERLVAYYGSSLAGAHFPFNFLLIQAPWNAGHIASLIDQYEAALPEGGWPNWVLGNHDKHRIASRIGQSQARIAAMLLLTLRGTPTLYYGDEIGMEDGQIPKELVRDPWEKNVPGLGLGRDPARTPMQWSAERNAGFSVAEPWLPVARDYVDRNVDVQSRDNQSLLMLYKSLIMLRNAEPAFQTGSYVPVKSNDDVLAYVRQGDEKQFLVLLNFAAGALRLRFHPRLRGRVILSTTADRAESIEEAIPLRGSEGVIIELPQRQEELSVDIQETSRL